MGLIDKLNKTFRSQSGRSFVAATAIAFSTPINVNAQTGSYVIESSQFKNSEFYSSLKNLTLDNWAYFYAVADLSMLAASYKGEMSREATLYRGILELRLPEDSNKVMKNAQTILYVLDPIKTSVVNEFLEAEGELEERVKTALGWGARPGDILFQLITRLGVPDREIENRAANVYTFPNGFKARIERDKKGEFEILSTSDDIKRLVTIDPSENSCGIVDKYRDPRTTDADRRFFENAKDVAYSTTPFRGLKVDGIGSMLFPIDSNGSRDPSKKWDRASALINVYLSTREIAGRKARNGDSSRGEFSVIYSIMTPEGKIIDGDSSRVAVSFVMGDDTRISKKIHTKPFHIVGKNNETKDIHIGVRVRSGDKATEKGFVYTFPKYGLQPWEIKQLGPGGFPELYPDIILTRGREENLLIPVLDAGSNSELYLSLTPKKERKAEVIVDLPPRWYFDIGSTSETKERMTTKSNEGLPPSIFTKSLNMENPNALLALNVEIPDTLKAGEYYIIAFTKRERDLGSQPTSWAVGEAEIK